MRGERQRESDTPACPASASLWRGRPRRVLAALAVLILPLTAILVPFVNATPAFASAALSPITSPQTYNYSLPFQTATPQNMWGPGNQIISNASYSVFDKSWNASGGFNAIGCFLGACFGASLNVSTNGQISLTVGVTGASPGGVSANYPVNASVTVNPPVKRTDTIDTSWSLGSGANLSTTFATIGHPYLTPYFDANFSIGGQVCIFHCWGGSYSPSIGPLTATLTLPTIPATLGIPIPGLSEYGITGHLYPFTDVATTSSVTGNVLGASTGTASLPSVSGNPTNGDIFNLNINIAQTILFILETIATDGAAAEYSADTTEIQVATDNQGETSDTQIPALSGSYGPISYTLLFVGVQFGVFISQNFSFDPQPTITLAMPTGVAYTVTDSAGTTVDSGTTTGSAPSLTFPLGDTLSVTCPDNLAELAMTPEFALANPSGQTTDFTNNTSFVFPIRGSLQALQVSADGSSIGPLISLSTPTARPSVQLTSGTSGSLPEYWTLGDISPFTESALTVPFDTTPPVTTPTLSGTLGANGWYISPVTLTLTPTDPDGYNLASTSYSTDGGLTWTTVPYSSSAILPTGVSETLSPPSTSVTFPDDGVYSVEYYSTDSAGVSAPPKTIDFKKNEAAPQITLSGVVNGGTYLNTATPVITPQSLPPVGDTPPTGTTTGTSGINPPPVITLNGNSYTSGTPITTPGTYTLKATSTDKAGVSQSISVTFSVVNSTELVYTGPASAPYNTPTTVSATILDTDPALSSPQPIGSLPVNFALSDNPSCSATSAASGSSLGSAACSITPSSVAGGQDLTMSFAGNSLYTASSLIQPFAVTPGAPVDVTLAPTTTTITSSDTQPYAGSASVATVSASLVQTSSGAGLAGRTVRFTASGNSGSASATATTSSAGVASTTLALPPGRYVLTAAFAGGVHYAASQATETLYVFQPTNFLVYQGADGGIVPGTGQDVRFYGSNWFTQAPFGVLDPQFDGLAATVTATSFSAPIGGSGVPSAPITLPLYIGVHLVSGASQSGNDFVGPVTGYVVVRLDSPYGYLVDPQDNATGVVVHQVDS